MPSVLADGIRILRQDNAAIVAWLVWMLWGAVVVDAVLRRINVHGSLPADRFSLAVAGWPVALLLLSVPTFLLGALLNLRPGMPGAFFTLGITATGLLLGARQRNLENPKSGVLPLAGLAVLFVLTAWIRLAFLARTALPLYFDSAEHYRIAQSLAGAYASGFGLTWPVATFYHLGFHLITALLTSITGINPAESILIGGQLVIAATPLCLYFLVRVETSSTAAGFLTVVLGIFGWYMPAYAVNWGKYPALYSLPAILFCLHAAYAAGRAEGGSRRALEVLSAVAALSAFVLQTRAIILIGMAIAAWWLGGLWVRQSRVARGLMLAVVILVLAFEILVVGSTPTLAAVLDPYVGSGLILTILVGVLAIPAFRGFPRLSFSCAAAVALVLLGLFLPVPGFRSSPLLDRPLAEMVLFAPLAILAGCGFAGAARFFAKVPAAVRAAGAFVIFAAIAGHALINYSFYPSTCCDLVHADDLVALDWIGKNLPSDDLIGISQSQLQDAPLPYPPLAAGTDAGVWITPMTGRPTTSLPYSIDFGTVAARHQLCGSGVDDVYVSADPYSFSPASLEAHPGWYAPELALPGARIYRVVGCGG